MIHRGSLPFTFPQSPLSHESLRHAESPPSDPLFCVFGLRVTHVKRKTLNAFFGHSRSFAYPKPYIQSDRRDEIYNLIPFDFCLEKTCYGRELPSFFYIFTGNPHCPCSLPVISMATIGIKNTSLTANPHCPFSIQVLLIATIENFYKSLTSKPHCPCSLRVIMIAAIENLKNVFDCQPPFACAP